MRPQALISTTKRSAVLFTVLLLFSVPWAYAYYNMSFGFKANGSYLLAFTTAAQTTVKASACSGAVTVQTQSSPGTPVAVTSNVNINLTSDKATVQFFSDSSCRYAVTTITVGVGSNSSSFYFTDSAQESPTLTAAGVNLTSASQTETTTSNGFVWTGGGADAYWATVNNWAGHAAPTATDVAYFDASCSSNCSPTINGNVSVSGVRMASGYTGTISSNTFTITIGTGGWTQLGGTFTGNGATMSDSGAFFLGGGTFNAPSTTLTYTGSAWTVVGAPTFNGGTGTVKFNNSTVTITPGSVSYNNVYFYGSNTKTLSTDTLKVYGTLTIDGTSTGAPINSGTVMAYGNVTYSGTGSSTASTGTIQVAGNASGQTITGVSGATIVKMNIAAGSNPVTLSGTLQIASYTMTSVGTFTVTGSKLLFQTSGGSTITPGAVTYNDVQFNTSYATTITGTFNVGGTLTLGAGVNLSGGTIMAYGDVAANGASYASTTAIQIAGNASGQTITGTSGAYIPNLTIAAGSNTVTFSGTVSVTGYYTYSSGNLSLGTSTLEIPRGGSITPGSTHYYNVSFASSYSANLNSNTLYVDGTLTFSGGGNPNSGTIVAAGNIVASTSGGASNTATATIQITGTNSVSITTCASGCGLPAGNVTVNLTGGAGLTLGGSGNTVTMNATGQTFSVTSGNINMNGNNLTVKSLSLNGNTITKGGGTLTVNGSTTVGSPWGGTVN